MNNISLPDDITHVSGRTSKSGGLYYKGVGTPYKCHASIKSNDYSIIGRNPVFYYGNDVVNRKWTGLFGIFQERFQPYFSDFIGSCGKKEKAIEKISKCFPKSAVDVVDSVCYDSDNQQSYYILDYKKSRSQFLDGGNVRELIELLSIMAASGWNFPWDKTSIRDINKESFVTDIADLFESSDIKHKFGSVYSVLYSLNTLKPTLYVKLLSSFGLKYQGISDIPFVVSFLLRLFGYDVPMRTDIKTREDAYCHLVGNILIRGRNCASVESAEDGDTVMLEYVGRFRSMLSDKQKRLMEI